MAVFIDSSARNPQYETLSDQTPLIKFISEAEKLWNFLFNADREAFNFIPIDTVKNEYNCLKSVGLETLNHLKVELQSLKEEIETKGREIELLRSEFQSNSTRELQSLHSAFQSIARELFTLIHNNERSIREIRVSSNDC